MLFFKQTKSIAANLTGRAHILARLFLYDVLPRESRAPCGA